jgi:hypothetical protein
MTCPVTGACQSRSVLHLGPWHIGASIMTCGWCSSRYHLRQVLGVMQQNLSTLLAVFCLQWYLPQVPDLPSTCAHDARNGLASLEPLCSMRAPLPSLPLWQWFHARNWQTLAESDTAPVPSPELPAFLHEPAARLAAELHGAVRQAHYGPCLAGRTHGHLPSRFEAEHRSARSSADLLQLVSGQALLGCVRQAPTTRLLQTQHDLASSKGVQ